MSENLLTVKEVVVRLKVSHMTIYRLVKAGKLNPIKIGKSVRFRESDIVSFMQEGAENFDELAAA